MRGASDSGRTIRVNVNRLNSVQHDRSTNGDARYVSRGQWTRSFGFILAVVNEEEKWLRDWNEPQNHRYDPGYYTGGRIDPFVRGLRAKLHLGYGWRLVMAAVLIGLAITASTDSLRVRVAGYLFAGILGIIGIAFIVASRRIGPTQTS
jgi:hypothetical protein